MAGLFGLDGQASLIMVVNSAFVVAKIAIVAILLAAGFNRTANRALAIFLLSHVWNEVFSGVLRFTPEFLGGQFGRNYAFARHSYFLDSLALLAFLANYPRRRQSLPGWATRLWPYLGLALVFEVIQTLWPATGFNPAGENGFLTVVDFLADSLGSIVVPLVLLREILQGRYEKPLGPLLLVGVLPAYFIAADLLTILDFAGATVEVGLTTAFSGTGSATSLVIRALVPLRFLLELALLSSLLWVAAKVPSLRRVALLVFATLVYYVVVWQIIGLRAQDFSYFMFVILVLPTRALQLGFIAYVALHDQAVGLNRKVRIGISRTALAAMFLGVFFVAAEVAQSFFSTEYGYLTGGIAAGMMLFAISPLQRFAERLAQVDKVAADDKTAQVYREAVELTLADRTITAREERHLAHLAERLGLAAGQAMDIRLGVQESLAARSTRLRPR